MPPVEGSEPARAYAQLKPIRNGHTREEVAKHQRARLYAAMIELLPVRGYAGTSNRELCARAGVSQKTTYIHFKSKEGYFLATYWMIVRRAALRVTAAYRAKAEWSEQIHDGFHAFIAEVVNQPGAARLALVESLGAGPRALEAMTSASAGFERMVGASFAKSPAKVNVPPIVLRAIVGGIARVVRQRLLDDRAADLPCESNELLGWMLSYHSNAARSLPPAPLPRIHKSPASVQPVAGSTDEGDRIMSAAALLAARYGYPNLSAAGIVQHARVSDDAFFDRFPGGVEECFMAAYNQMGGEMAAYAADIALTEEEWPRAVRAALAAVMWRIASDDVFAQVAFVQVFAVGPSGVTSRSELMARFSELLLRRSPPNERPSELAAEAIVGAVWQLVHHYVVRGAARRLPMLTDLATYLVLVPTLGGEGAMQHVRNAQVAR